MKINYLNRLLPFLLVLAPFQLFSQEIQLSSEAEISVITVDPGSQLVDAFGHSAFRIKDSPLGIDQAYNYGMYNFNTPNFYNKFARGKLLYDLGSYPFHLFLKSYVKENRTVKEQILLLSLQEKQQFFEFLQHNAKPENKSYLYDFLFDNCATKLPEVSSKILKGNIEFNYDFEEKDLTFRDLIHLYLNEQPWGALGIDLALGSVIDRKATPKEYTFLPDYVFESYRNSSLNSQPIVKETKILFEAEPKEKGRKFFTPLVLFSLLAVLVILITFNDFKKKKRSKWLDFFLFFTTGIIGLLVLLLWLATDHTATANNYNIFWAFMPNLIVAFQLLKNNLKGWIRKYSVLLVILLIMTAIFWILKVQVFSIAIIPILLMLFVRYWFLSKV